MAGGFVGEEELARIPALHLQRSPLLLKLRGEQLLRRGALVEAREVLLSAVQGFARQTYQTMLLDTLAPLAVVYLRLTEWQDAKTVLQFLKEESIRRESPISGRVLQSLAWGCYLIDETGWEESYTRQAWEQYKQDGDHQGIVETGLDLLLYWGSEMSARERERLYYFAEQKAMVNPVYRPLQQLASALISSSRQQWEQATAVLDALDTSGMSYHHAALCLVRRLEFDLKAGLAADPGKWDELEHIRILYGGDLFVQFQLAQLQYKRAERQGESELAEALLYKLMSWQELTRHPGQADWLQWVQMKKEKQSAEGEDGNGWEICCIGTMTFRRGETEIKDLKWKRKKALELFIYLLIQPGYATPKEQIMEILLGQGYADKMNNQLYVILHQLKQTLKQELQAEPNVIVKDGIIRLHKGLIQSLDVEQYRLLINEGDQLWSKSPALAVICYERAYELYGEFMPEIRYIDWVDAFRESLLEMQTAVLRKLAHYYRDAGQYVQAEAFFARWIELSPVDEVGYQEFMEHLVARGRKQEARRVRRKWEKLVGDEQEASSPLVLDQPFSI
ncbi:bacterial transcriptional activator domain-containing protein [Paenibacillus piri]|nr:BTAD domain-containing putative transcriptional regulator [Paenibacillus piri]